VSGLSRSQVTIHVESRTYGERSYLFVAIACEPSQRFGGGGIGELEIGRMPPERLDRVLPMSRDGVLHAGGGYQGLGRVGIADAYECVDGLIPGFSGRGCAESLDRLLQERVV